MQGMKKIIRNEKGQWGIGNQSGQQFTSERSLGNKNALGNPPNKTSFKKGVNAMEGSKSWKGGLQKMKDGYYVAVAPYKRVKRARIVYEQAYGYLPKDMVVFHLDGDCYNDDINNLEAITRGELARRNKLK